MNLKEFVALGAEEAVCYDFKREVFNLRNIPYNSERIINFILYTGNFYNDDCDRLPLTLEVYQSLWANGYNYWDIEDQKEFVKSNGETMNSFKTSYRKISNGKFYHDNSLINEFSVLTHTLGNFMPVYAEKKDKSNWSSPFNKGRYPHTYDYWDLTLKDIKNYYEGKNDKDYIRESERWLASFKDWPNFIEKNFLLSFLEDDSDSSSNPKEFWEGHFNTRTKPNQEQLHEFLTFANSAIKKRGLQMYNELALKI